MNPKKIRAMIDGGTTVSKSTWLELLAYSERLEDIIAKNDIVERVLTPVGVVHNVTDKNLTIVACVEGVDLRDYQGQMLYATGTTVTNVDQNGVQSTLTKL